AAARPWFARYLCREAPPELRAVSLARRSFAALPFGARESTEARRRRFEREATDHALSGPLPCAPARAGDRGAYLLTDSRDERPREPPWHLVLLALGLAGWLALRDDRPVE
ncbi:MAG: hypothetical protein KC468_33095, partial [Myxococcales bacterium]|nr:hypothetical protein [Myxococcales bacterium]